MNIVQKSKKKFKISFKKKEYLLRSFNFVSVRIIWERVLSRICSLFCIYLLYYFFLLMVFFSFINILVPSFEDKIFFSLLILLHSQKQLQFFFLNLSHWKFLYFFSQKILKNFITSLIKSHLKKYFLQKNFKWPKRWGQGFFCLTGRVSKKYSFISIKFKRRNY